MPLFSKKEVSGSRNKESLAFSRKLSNASASEHGSQVKKSEMPMLRRGTINKSTIKGQLMKKFARRPTIVGSSQKKGEKGALQK